MDKAALVKTGHDLIEAMAARGVPARAAVWMHNLDLDTWRLWVVPPETMKDKREFYRAIAEIVSEHQEEFRNFDASDVLMTSDHHPAFLALSKMFRVTGRSDVEIHNNMLNGIFVPEGIILQMDL